MATVWTYQLIGDPLASDHGTPYIEVSCTPKQHDDARLQAWVEDVAHMAFGRDFPGHVVADSGWYCTEMDRAA